MQSNTTNSCASYQKGKQPLQDTGKSACRGKGEKAATWAEYQLSP